MAIIVKTVGSVGRQYTTHQAAIDSIPKNLVTDGNSYVIESWPDSEFVYITQVMLIQGFTTDATHFLTFRCASGKSFHENASVETNALRYNPANGVAIKMTSNYTAAIENYASYTVFDGLQILGTNYTSTGIFSHDIASFVTIKNCIFDGKPQATSGVNVRADGLNNLLQNILIINRQPDTKGIVTFYGNTIIESNTIVCIDTVTGSTAIQTDAASTIVRNNAIFGFTTPLAVANAIAGDGHNATDAASFTGGGGTNSLTGLTKANQFVSGDGTTPDFRTKTGSALIDAGVTTSNTTAINSLTRPTGAAFDIGAWEFASPPAAPNAPTIGTATSGNTSASVTFTTPANNGGSTILDYTATSSPGGFTATSATSPITVAGLTNGTAYTFTVKARNAIGSSVASAASNSVTPAALATGTVTSQPAPDGQSQQFIGTTANAVSGSYTLVGSAGGVTQGPTAFTITSNAFNFIVTSLVAGTYTPNLTVTNSQGAVSTVTGTSPFTIAAVSGGGAVAPGGGSTTAPTAPTIGTATAGNASATVTFTAPSSDGGSAILDYTATSSPSGITVTGSSSPLTVTGLINGTPYTFTVTARNAIGSSAASNASNVITPAVPVTTATGTITSQTAPTGQSEQFVGTTTNAVSGTYTLVGSAGGVTQGPTAFTVTSNTFNFTVSNLVAGTYTPNLTVLNSQGSSSTVAGTSTFTATPIVIPPSSTPMTKRLIKVTPTKATVQFIDAGGTLSLGTDLLSAGQTPSGSPKVYITGLTFSCAPTENISITRNSVKTISVTNVGHLDMAMTLDATSDIVVACPANGMIIIELSKVDGYSSTIPNIGTNEFGGV
jgi:hypothetical protein